MGVPENLLLEKILEVAMSLGCSIVRKECHRYMWDTEQSRY